MFDKLGDLVPTIGELRDPLPANAGDFGLFQIEGERGGSSIEMVVKLSEF